MKRTQKLLSILLTLVMMLSLLPMPAQAALDRNTIYSVAVTVDPLVVGDTLPAPEVPTDCTVSSYEWRQGSTLLGSNAIAQAGKTYMLIMTLEPAGKLMRFDPNAAVTINGKEPQAIQQSVSQIVCAASFSAGNRYTVTVNGGTINGGASTGEYLEGKSVTITADDPASGKEFKEWDGGEDLTFTVGSATSATATFTMPAEDVELTATYRWQKPDTTPVRPEGDGTSGNPFEIGTVGELYWFAGFLNDTITADDITVAPAEACAVLTDDITVNPDLLTADYALNEEDTAQLAAWEPIALANGYKGTFDGQGYTISGIYYDPQTDQADVNYGGFFGQLAAGGCICNLTLEDSYFCAPTEKASAYTGGIVGEIGTDASVENCHFDGTVTTGDSEGYDTLGGISAVNQSDIRNCTSKGLISGYAKNAIGGIVGSMVQGTVTDCVNKATVKNLVSGTGMDSDTSGGIVGTMATGTIQECHNEGTIIGNNSGGIVGGAGWAYNEGTAILRCWNKGMVESGAGIAHSISGDNATIKNCYNAGSVRYGIVNSYTGNGHSVTYCHNVGDLTAGFDFGAPIISAFDSDSDIVVANCYYMADSELDEFDGTTAMTEERFSRQDIQMVTKLLNASNNGNWKQGGDYPILNKMFTLTVTNGTGSGTYGAGTKVAITATVPDGMVFAGWEGIDDVDGEDSVSTTIVMPEEDVTLTAKFVSLTPVRPAGDGTSGNPFEISTVGELYWFAGFVNGTIEKPADITVSIEKACAKVMNDITVNRNLLTKDYALNVSGEDTALLAAWKPIAPNGYKGTFDGQGYTISGIYCAPQAADDYKYGGFFRSLSEDFTADGCIRDLTLEDSYFCAPAKNSGYMGAFAGYISSNCTVENCHFDGTVTTAITADSSDEDKETYQYVHIAGIVGFAYGEIRDCTARGLISGYGSEMGGIAAYVSDSEVTGCVNEATVENSYSGDTGGIVGRMVRSGIIRDCCNKGNVIGRSSAGIVSNVESKGGQVIRCWNEGDIQGYYTAGIVAGLSGTVLNCYNAGSVDEAGIAGTAYSGSSVAYCHNVGEITGYMGEPICSVSSGGSNITIENCYYLADSETDSVGGTTYKTTAEFKDGTVLARLNGGDNAGSWTQGTDYPVLNTIYTLTVRGGTGGGEYAAGTEVTITATVPDGMVFASWSGTEGLTFTGGTDKFSETATFTMPAKSVTVEAVCNTLITAANAYVTVPLVGAHPDVTPESGDPDKYTVEFESWRLVTASSGELSGVDLTESDSFETLGTGQSYQLDVLFVPKEGYQFASNATYTLNDDLSTVPFSTNYRYRRYFFKDIDELVTSINLKGISAPAAGKNPNTSTITTDTAGISLSAMQWKKPGGAAMASTDKFTAGDTYTLHIEYTVKSGYVVSDEVTVTSDLADSTYTANTTADPKYVDIQYTVPELATYPVTIIGGKFNVPGGTASGEFAPDSTLAIIATPPEGKRFVKWTSEDVSFSNEYASATSFRMPAYPVTITAVYEDSHYPCTIVGGTFADGSTSSKFEVYEKVVIIPNDPPAGKMFSKWEATPAAAIRQSSDGTYYFSMPNWAVQIQAVYVDAELCMEAWRDSTEVSGGYSEVVSVQVEYLDTVEGLDPAIGAMLVVAQYSCNDDDYGKMTDVYLCSVKEDGTYVTPAYVHGEEEWFEYQAILLDGKTWEPLYDTYWVSGD